MILSLANHLWQSTLCLCLAALLIRVLKHQGARWRYRVWLAASLKFVVPFAVLMTLGARLPLPTTPTVSVTFAVHAIGEPFAATDAAVAMPDDGSGPSWLAAALLDETVLTVAAGIWLMGAIVLVAWRTVRWRRVRAMLQRATPLPDGRERAALDRMRTMLGVPGAVALRASDSWLEPAVVGVFRPAIVWPSMLTTQLTDRELDAIFAHELLHIRRRDNLTAAVHGLLTSVFWFHPALWWLESRLLAERERACDEAVLRFGNEPHIYARSILKVCNFCLRLPAPAAAGVTGANLTQRVEEIMEGRPASSLNAVRKILLATAALALVAGPVVLGSLRADAAPGVLPDPPVVVGLDATAGEPQTATGRITGVVTDQRGDPISGVEVKVGADAKTVAAITDSAGRYSVDLPPAQYVVRFEKPGFSSAQTTVFLNRGASLERSVQLRIGAVSESINVSAASDLETVKKLLQQGQYSEAEAAVDRALTKLQSSSRRRVLPASNGETRVVTQRPDPPAGVVRVGGDVAPPKKIHNVPPIYPQEAKDNGISGIVIIDAIIGKDGAVKDANVLRGLPILNQAALDAVTQWRFSPTLLNGAPVEVQMTVTVNFQKS